MLLCLDLQTSLAKKIDSSLIMLVHVSKLKLGFRVIVNPSNILFVNTSSF